MSDVVRRGLRDTLIVIITFAVVSAIIWLVSGNWSWIAGVTVLALLLAVRWALLLHRSTRKR